MFLITFAASVSSQSEVGGALVQMNLLIRMAAVAALTEHQCFSAQRRRLIIRRRGVAGGNAALEARRNHNSLDPVDLRGL